jgi:hypothetical protein
MRPFFDYEKNPLNLPNLDRVFLCDKLGQNLTVLTAHFVWFQKQNSKVIVDSFIRNYDVSIILWKQPN